MFNDALCHVVRQEGGQAVVLPRSEEQAVRALSRGCANLQIPPKAGDGPNLLYHADLVIRGAAR